MRAVWRLYGRLGPIPTICYILALVCGLLVVLGVQARRAIEERRRGDLLDQVIGLGQYELVLREKAMSMEQEVARLQELAATRKHQLELQGLRISNCETMNQVLYNRDAEQRKVIRACWEDKQWFPYFDRSERTTRRGP